jgi:predicted SAM-dependent methyltransferase
MSEIKLNLGCGGRPLGGYINVDMDSADELRRRYPSHKFSPDLKVYNYDILNLPYEGGTVDEVRADAFIEHLSFTDEPKFFGEVYRVLKSDGMFNFVVPDFEEIVKDWLKAKDDWKEFYRTDDEAIAQNHWFGTYTYAKDNRWGYATAAIFGTQNGEGQSHKNCYTEGKVRAMLKYLGFVDVDIKRERWKGDRDIMLVVQCRKA